MRFISFAIIAVLSACAAQTPQTNIFVNSSPDMEKVESECADKTAQEKNKHVAAVSCRFDAYEVILGERGFEEYNDLDVLQKHFIDIAKKQDTHKIDDESALGLSEKYTQEFLGKLQEHDNLKAQGYAVQKRIIMQDVEVIALGLSTGLQAYANARDPAGATAYQQPSCPACDRMHQTGQQIVTDAQRQKPSNYGSLSDSYISPPPAPLGIGQGSRGYDGSTGQANRRYVPVDSALTPGMTPEGYSNY